MSNRLYSDVEEERIGLLGVCTTLFIGLPATYLITGYSSASKIKNSLHSSLINGNVQIAGERYAPYLPALCIQAPRMLVSLLEKIL